MITHVQIQGITPRIQYVANGILTTFEFPFAIFSADDIDVYLNETIQADNTYTVSGIRHTDGGSITFATAPTENTIITIVRNLPIERTSDFQEGGALRADVLNDELDYQIACQQQIADNLNRSMVLPPYAVSENINLTLPTPSAGKAIVWSNDGISLENSTIPVNSLETTIRSYKDAAESASAIATQKATEAGSASALAVQKAAAIEEALANVQSASSSANGADKDLSNLSATGKINAFRMTIPSASNALMNVVDTVVTTSFRNYTAPADGYFYASCAKYNGAIEFYKNNEIMGYGGTANTSNNSYFGVMIPCKRGDVVSYHTTAGSGSIWASIFYYAEGAL